MATAFASQAAPALAAAPTATPHAAEQSTLRQRHYAVRYEDADLSLGSAPGRGGYPHLVARLRNGQQSVVDLRGFPFEVLSFQKAVGNKIIIIADAAEPAMDVYILDKANLRITASFLCYSPSPSPDGRWVLFTNFYPLHGVDEYQSSDFTRLFDVSAPPAPNVGPDPVQTASGDFGLPIYPRSNKLERTRRDGTLITHRRQWPSHWSPDSKKAAFFDAQFPGDPISLGAHSSGNVIANAKLPPSAALNLVLVDVSGPTPKVRKLDTGLCQGDPGSSMCYPPEPKFTFGPSSVTLDAVTHGTEQPWLHVEYPYSAFHAR